MTPTCTFACLARYLKLLFYYCRYNSRLSTSSDPERGDTDEDNNSPRSYSNRSSPAAGQLTAPAAYVLSASGGQIIAVQNPALSLSAAFPPPRGAAHTVVTLSSGQGSPITLMTSGGGRSGRLPASTPPGMCAMKQEPSSPASPPRHREKDWNWIPRVASVEWKRRHCIGSVAAGCATRGMKCQADWIRPRAVSRKADRKWKRFLQAFSNNIKKVNLLVILCRTLTNLRGC